MTEPVDVRLFFNFRSPYCYLASKSLWTIFDDFHTRLVFTPLPGWSGRSDPDRAKIKIPLVRQDVKRWARRLGIPFNPPPITTDPTRAGAASLHAEKAGKLRAFIVETMRVEWAEGRDIGDSAVLRDIAERVGLDGDAVIAAADDPANLATLAANAEEAKALGVFGVPTFLIGEEMFWGNDRIDFVVDHLMELRLRRL